MIINQLNFGIYFDMPLNKPNPFDESQNCVCKFLILSEN